MYNKYITSIYQDPPVGVPCLEAILVWGSPARTPRWSEGPGILFFPFGSCHIFRSFGACRARSRCAARWSRAEDLLRSLETRLTPTDAARLGVEITVHDRKVPVEPSGGQKRPGALAAGFSCLEPCFSYDPPVPKRMEGLVRGERIDAGGIASRRGCVFSCFLCSRFGSLVECF